MHGKELLHKLLVKSLSSIHKKRLGAISNAVHALILGKQLTLTQLGRHMNGMANERHNVRKVDRLLGNKTLHGELALFYIWQAELLLSRASEVAISVDWSTTDKRKDKHILRASTSVQGRSQPIYQEVHDDSGLNSHKIHKEFLRRLKEILPAHVKVILITDAGFCNPWFKEAETLGFDWIGRTKSTIQYTKKAKGAYIMTFKPIPLEHPIRCRLFILDARLCAVR